MHASKPLDLLRTHLTYLECLLTPVSFLVSPPPPFHHHFRGASAASSCKYCFQNSSIVFSHLTSTRPYNQPPPRPLGKMLSYAIKTLETTMHGIILNWKSKCCPINPDDTALTQVKILLHMKGPFKDQDCS